MRLWQERNGKGGDAAAAAVDTHEVRLWHERNGKGAKSAPAVTVGAPSGEAAPTRQGRAPEISERGRLSRSF